MIEKNLRFKASDGKEIAYNIARPEGPARAKLLVAHGMNDHASRFFKLADALNPLGMELWIPDLRGHGATDGGLHRGLLDKKEGFDRSVLDLSELAQAAAQANPSTPVYFFGHSYGALLGMALIAQYGAQFAGAALSAPPEKPSPLFDAAGCLILGLGKTCKGSHAPGKLPRAISFGAYAKTVKDARTASDWISRDKNEVAAYEADPDCAFICSYGFYYELAQGLRKVYSPGFLDSIPKNLPLYLFAGSKDPVIGMKRGFQRLARRLSSLGLVDFESRCYEDGRHESINEINAAEVLADIAAWYKARLGALG